MLEVIEEWTDGDYLGEKKKTIVNRESKGSKIRSDEIIRVEKQGTKSISKTGPKS